MTRQFSLAAALVALPLTLAAQRLPDIERTIDQDESPRAFEMTLSHGGTGGQRAVWRVAEPPRNGDVRFELVSDGVRVDYDPDPGFSGVDRFEVMPAYGIPSRDSFLIEVTVLPRSDIRRGAPFADRTPATSPPAAAVTPAPPRTRAVTPPPAEPPTRSQPQTLAAAPPPAQAQARRPAPPPAREMASLLASEDREQIREAELKAREYLDESDTYRNMLAHHGVKHGEQASVSLGQAINLTLERDLTLAQTREQITERDAAARNARFGYYPRVSLIGEYGLVSQEVISTDNQVFQEGNADFDTSRAQAEILQPLLDFTTIRDNRSAKTGAAAARAALAARAHDAVFETVSTYVRALEMQAQLEGIEQRLKLLAAQRDAEQRTADSGFGTDDAVNLISIEIGATYAEQITVASQYARALTDLSRAIGRPVERVVDVSAAGASLNMTRANIAALVADALEQNPAVELQRLQTLRAEQERSRAWASDHLPVVEAFLRSEYEDREASRFGGGSVTFDTTVGLRLRVPLFNATGQGHRHREQASRARQSILQEADLRRELEAEIGTLVPRLALERAAHAEARRVVDASRALVRSARDASRAGVATELMALRQSLHLAQAETRALRARYQYLMTRARLAYLTGKPLAPMFTGGQATEGGA